MVWLYSDGIPVAQVPSAAVFLTMHWDCFQSHPDQMHPCEPRSSGQSVQCTSLLDNWHANTELELGSCRLVPWLLVCLDLRQGQVLYLCCLKRDRCGLHIPLHPLYCWPTSAGGRQTLAEESMKRLYPAYCQIACCCHHACMSFHMPCVPQACLLLLCWVLCQKDTLSCGGQKHL